MKTHLRTFGAAAALLAAAGCGSASSSTAVTNLPKPPQSVTAGTEPVTISFSIPRAAGSANSDRRKPLYISPSTESVTVGVDSGSPSAATANCSGSACTVTVDLTPGSHTLALRLWDAPNGAGNELASNTSAPCSVTVAIANTCSVTMYGLAASLQVTSSSANVSGNQANGFTFVSGTSTPFTVVALDADGNQILGVGGITPAVSATATGISIATPAPSASPVYDITDTNTAAENLSVATTPAPNSDGSNLSTTVSLTGANTYAGSLFFFSGSPSTFDVVSATTGQTTLSITSPVSGAPFAAATSNYVLLNASSDATLYLYDLLTDAITQTITTSCSSSDNVPIAADGGLFYYDCGGTVYEYNTSGTQEASWADHESNSGFVAAGGGYIYTISGTTVYVFTPAGTEQGTFSVPSAPSPQWAFAASAQGLFVGAGTTVRLYSPAGTLITTLTVGTPDCDFQPVGSYLTVRTGPVTFKTYSVSTGQEIGSITTTATPSDCRVGFSN